MKANRTTAPAAAPVAAHLPNAEEQARLLAEAEAVQKAKDERRAISLRTVSELGRDHAKGAVSLMLASHEYQHMVRVGDANAEDDAAIWYQAFAKGHNEYRDVRADGLTETVDTKDSDAVSRWRTFVRAPVLAITAIMPDFYQRVLSVRKSLDAENRDSTYNTLVFANRKVSTWNDDTGEDFDALRTALANDFDSTVRAWLMKGKAAPKSPAERLENLVAQWAKVAKRSNSDPLATVVTLMREAIDLFKAEVAAGADARKAFELQSAEQAKVRLTVGGETIQ